MNKTFNLLILCLVIITFTFRTHSEELEKRNYSYGIETNQ